MNQRKKNLRLLLLLIGLVGISISLNFMGGIKPTDGINSTQFKIEDTASVAQIIITSASLSNTLERKESGWTINSNEKADENIMRVFLSIMSNVTINRTLKGDLKREVISRSKSEGINVCLKLENGEESCFTALGNPNQTLSYFVKEEEVYVVELPGYDSYVTGIFEITEIDWQSRLIFSTSLSSFSKAEITYLNHPEWSFTIEPHSNFLFVNELELQDTIMVLDYTEQFAYLQADRFIREGENTEYDSLTDTEPEVIFTLSNYFKEQPIKLSFFRRLPGDQMVLAKIEDGRKGLFEYNRIKGLFVRRSYFEYKK